MEELDMISFEIISSVGMARSCYIEAIRLAKEKKYEEAQQKIEAGDKGFIAGHNAHMKLLKVEKDKNMGILVIHAENQLMSAETFKLLAVEFIDMYKELRSEGNNEEKN